MIVPDLSLETAAWTEQYRLVAGIDEAGRGAWAGPVAAAAVVLSPDCPDLLQRLDGVRDSKTLSARQREMLFDRIQAEALAVGLGMVDSETIVQEGIAAATRLAMAEAVDALGPRPDFLLIDYIRLPRVNIPQKSFRKGDQRSLSIAAASIVAKVSRDRLMAQLGETFPDYGFEQHKGYGTRRHRAAVQKNGITPEHRRNWKPCQELMAKG